MMKHEQQSTRFEKMLIFFEDKNCSKPNLYRIILFLIMFVISIVNCQAQDNLLIGKWHYWLDNSKKEAGSKITVKNDTILVESYDSDKKGSYSIQLVQNLNLEKDKTYKLCFDAQTDTKGVICIVYCMNEDPWTCFFSSDIVISPDKTQYECAIIPKAVKEKYDGPQSIRFFLGGLKNAKITITKISLVDVKR